MESQRQFLAGDALLNYAYETAFRAFDLLDESDMEEWKRVAKALSILGKKTGIDGMLGGQSVDVENDKKSRNWTGKCWIIFMKIKHLH